MEDEIERKLAQIVEGEDDKDLAWAKELYEDEFEKAQERVSVESVDVDEMARRTAVGAVRKAVNVTTGVFGGEVEELPVLALGYSMEREGNYFVTDGRAIVALGIVNPPEDPAGIATFIVDSDDGVDLTLAKETFEPLNTARVWMTRMQTDQIDSKGGNPVYVCNSTDKTKLESVSPDSVDDDDPIAQLPAGKEAKRDMIHAHFITEEDHVDLQTVPEHLSIENDNGYEAAFGADVKRFRGQIIDVYSDHEQGFGTMTLLDDTVTSPDEVSEEILGDDQRTPGLQVMIHPEHCDYGENSIVDVYGYIQRTDDGQARMQGFGVIPIVDFERDNSSDGGNGKDDDRDTETI